MDPSRLVVNAWKYGGLAHKLLWAVDHDTWSQPQDECVQIEKAMMNVESWMHFDVFEVAKLVKGHILAAVVFYSLERYNLIDKLDIPEDKLYNFVAVSSPRFCARCTVVSCSRYRNPFPLDMEGARAAQLRAPVCFAVALIRNKSVLTNQ